MKETLRASVNQRGDREYFHIGECESAEWRRLGTSGDRYLSWQPFEGGTTVGQNGCDGVIVRDEEHADGARITIEEGADIAPFLITCGIYGWTYHTRYFASLTEATPEFELMKAALEVILAPIPLENDPRYAERMRRVADEISRFVKRFP